MYKAYFGLKESPFSIAPNPRFLFMSERHKEALAHLSYGLGETGGFALLTGEVGTGKTTISRRLMEQLPENTQAAFILNPTLSSQELLATICDELKVRYRKTGATLKTLTDKIHEKLNKNHQTGINTLLIIDEAQHLAPEVLEQLRLLTNLETDTKKLLQVILIGQPELKQLLQRRDLRQLAQRITARYHLLPLTKIEIAQYIQHRLSVALCERKLFDKAAIAEIHHISQGIPRIINLLCERSLTNAYCTNNALVNKKIVLQSAQEALGDEYQTKLWWQHIAVKVTTASITLAVIITSAYYFGQLYGQSVNKQSLIASTSPATAVPITIPIVAPISKRVAVSTDNSFNNLAKSKVLEVKPEKLGVKESPKEFVIESHGEEKRAIEVTPEQTPTAVKQQAKEKEAFTLSATEGVSDDLFSRFQSAMKAADNDMQISEDQPEVEENAPTLSDMPNWVQNGVPALTFDLHIYTSEGDSWVRVNGRDRYEGDNIAKGLVLQRIYAQKVILSFKGERFSLPALSTW
jgi:type II secretory pathway predicted ATPase ExeA